MTTPARALLVTPDYPPNEGGIGRLLNSLVSLTSDCTEWRVVTTTPGPPTAGVVRVRGHAGLVLGGLRHRRWLRGAERRVVVCGHAYAVWPSLAAGWSARAPVSVIAHGDEVVARRFRHTAVLASLRACDRVVAVSRHTAGLLERLGVPGHRLRVANPLAEPWTLGGEPRRRCTGSGLRLVMISRLAGCYKNAELAVRLVSVLQSTGLVAGLTVIGDGPRREGLAQLAASLGVSSAVQFAGGIDDASAREVLANAHIGLMPSRDSPGEGSFEGFGLVIQELAAASMPVLVGRSGGTEEAAGSAWSILLDPDDLRAWTATVAHLAADEDDRLEMANAAASWARALDPGGAAHGFLRELGGCGCSS